MPVFGLLVPVALLGWLSVGEWTAAKMRARGQSEAMGWLLGLSLVGTFAWALFPADEHRANEYAHADWVGPR